MILHLPSVGQSWCYSTGYCLTSDVSIILIVRESDCDVTAQSITFLYQFLPGLVEGNDVSVSPRVPGEGNRRL